MLCHLLLSLSLLLIDSHKFPMCIPIRALLRRDVVHDTMEDVVAGPNAGTVLENVRAWITASRMTIAGGGSLDRHVDAVILSLLLLEQLVGLHPCNRHGLEQQQRNHRRRAVEGPRHGIPMWLPSASLSGARTRRSSSGCCWLRRRGRRRHRTASWQMGRVG